MFSEGPIDALHHFRLGNKLLRNYGVTKPLLDAHNTILRHIAEVNLTQQICLAEGVARCEDVDRLCQEYACAKS